MRLIGLITVRRASIIAGAWPKITVAQRQNRPSRMLEIDDSQFMHRRKAQRSVGFGFIGFDRSSHQHQH
jgi:hypothetical protein